VKESVQWCFKRLFHTILIIIVQFLYYADATKAFHMVEYTKRFSLLVFATYDHSLVIVYVHA